MRCLLVPLVFFLLFHVGLLAQDSIEFQEQMESIDAASAVTYPDLRSDLETYFSLRDSDTKNAYKTIREASRKADRLFADLEEPGTTEMDLWQQAEGYLALSQLSRGKVVDAEKHWDKVYSIHDPVLDKELERELIEKRPQLDSALKELKFNKVKDWMRQADPAEKIGQGLSSGARRIKADMEIRLFRTYANKGRVHSAVKHYANATTLLSELGDEEGLEELEEEYERWLEQMDQDLTTATEVTGIDTASMASEERLNSLIAEAEAIENSGLSEEQSALFERYKALQQAIAEEEKKSALALLEKENQIEDQEREILLLEQENELTTLSLEQQRLLKEEESRKKRNLGIGLALLSALLLMVFVLYRNKYRSNQRLAQARDDLAVANKKVESLLQQQVSGDIADTLIHGASSEVQERFVAVLFTDIRDFTPKVSALKPEEIIRYQNDVFGFMIDIIEKHHGNINQLMGDGFMATFGAPKSFGNDVQNAVNASMEILEELASINAQGKILETEIGIGIDCGMAVMGNVGNASRKQFSITGNVVISAARIEQANKRLDSHLLVSEEVMDRVAVEWTERVHTVPLKGRAGERKLYELVSPLL